MNFFSLPAYGVVRRRPFQNFNHLLRNYQSDWLQNLVCSFLMVRFTKVSEIILIQIPIQILQHFEIFCLIRPCVEDNFNRLLFWNYIRICLTSDFVHSFLILPLWKVSQIILIWIWITILQHFAYHLWQAERTYAHVICSDMCYEKNFYQKLPLYKFVHSYIVYSVKWCTWKASLKT